MKIYFHKWLLILIAIFYERTDMSNEVHRARVANGLATAGVRSTERSVCVLRSDKYDGSLFAARYKQATLASARSHLLYHDDTENTSSP